MSHQSGLGAAVIFQFYTQGEQRPESTGWSQELEAYPGAHRDHALSVYRDGKVLFCAAQDNDSHT